MFEEEKLIHNGYMTKTNIFAETLAYNEVYVNHKNVDIYHFAETRCPCKHKD